MEKITVRFLDVKMQNASSQNVKGSLSANFLLPLNFRKDPQSLTINPNLWKSRILTVNLGKYFHS